jgi:hypothetical protein
MRHLRNNLAPLTSVPASARFSRRFDIIPASLRRNFRVGLPDLEA